jgi:S2P endopeptidase
MNLDMPWLRVCKVAKPIHQNLTYSCLCREHIPVLAVGLNFYGIYPGAFVDLSANALQAVSARKRLRIVCAGVWHNLILAVLGAMLLSILPSLYSPFYQSIEGEGVVVTGIKTFHEPSTQLPIGVTLVDINGHSVYDTASWQQVLDRLQAHRQGYCVSKAFIGNHKCASHC